MIQIRNLNKSYNKIKVLDDISLEIKPGEISALLGPNGSGKTTLIKSILKLRFPDSGFISKNIDTYNKSVSTGLTVIDNSSSSNLLVFD